MPSKQFGLPAALRRRPVLGLIAILIVLVIAYVVSDRDADSGAPEAPSASTSLGLGAASIGAPTSSSTASTSAAATVDPESGLRYVNESALPVEAAKTLALIASDGPYPYSQDGATFQNRERLLPARPGGYYREYTVRTPGEEDRGPRRIIAGADGQRYYTGDHYSSFKRIRVGR